MPITADTLMAPQGDISVSFFPGETSAQVEQRLGLLLTQGYARTRAAGIADDESLDAAARAWTYHRAYTAIQLRFANMPANTTLDSGQGGVAISVTQLQTWGNMSAQWLAIYRSIVPDVADGPSTLAGGVVQTRRRL